MQEVLHRTEFKHGLQRTIVKSQFCRWGVRLTQRRGTELLPSWQPDRHLPPANDGAPAISQAVADQCPCCANPRT